MKFNDGVSSLLREMKAELGDFSYSFFDTYAALMEIIENPSSYGMAVSPSPFVDSWLYFIWELMIASQRLYELTCIIDHFNITTLFNYFKIKISIM